jgi:hypothetical protein
VWELLKRRADWDGILVFLPIQRQSKIGGWIERIFDFQFILEITIATG